MDGPSRTPFKNQVGPSVNTGVSVFLEAGAADAPPDGHQPLPLRAAVHLRSVPLLRVVHALPPHLHQRGRVGPRHHVGEHGQVSGHGGAALVVHPDGDDGDAGPDVLEGQVEAPLAEGPHASHLRVQLQPPNAQVHAGEALVGRDGVDLGELALPDVGPDVAVDLVVVEVEGLLAGAQYPGHAVAVSQGELDLDVDASGAISLDPVGAQPIVLTGAHDVTHLVGVDGAEVLVHLIDSIPLAKNEKNLD
ncbi:hypothetical protein SKAU_G00170780 [Synaphobranchus kaupii]|uniref:Uncharacterized protein n=1 Tax=Synaphobranchus kaupii TaxID=118154 RepID=A0A9Q1FKM1_SYNKA|nr:hypothetical protein SKAU_G00170780 [Synaphobranchus kaupii]